MTRAIEITTDIWPAVSRAGHASPERAFKVATRELEIFWPELPDWLHDECIRLALLGVQEQVLKVGPHTTDDPYDLWLNYDGRKL